MIHIFFVPGMFGSTIEYVVRSVSNELTPTIGTVLADGSMHSFKKQAHIGTISDIDDFFNKNISCDVTTPIYPFEQMHLPEILEKFSIPKNNQDHYVLMHASNLRDSELNMLFQYHKICQGLGLGLKIFCGNSANDIVQWNPGYTHFDQMFPWQLREWFSLFYASWVQEWVDSVNQVNQQFLPICNSDFLFDPMTAIEKIFKHCKLTPKSNLENFLQHWQLAQQYIVDEFNLLDLIVKNSIDNAKSTWNPVNIIAEAIVQQRLRSHGYEIRCDGLDVFPTDSQTLHNLLEKI